jgi:hypothetical protein
MLYIFVDYIPDDVSCWDNNFSYEKLAIFGVIMHDVMGAAIKVSGDLSPCYLKLGCVCVRFFFFFALSGVCIFVGFLAIWYLCGLDVYGIRSEES